jgi:demethylmenaquinone methyltransferase/2-methoxy-6-polyprenyl-1,4-benzoquinol methylase
MTHRRPGLQKKWAYVVNSLQQIVPTYEKASSRISLFEDGRMRSEAVEFAVSPGSTVLDLGSGPGTMSRIVQSYGGNPVLLDVSRVMLRHSGFDDVVQGAFEFLPFRDGGFDAVVSGFALRDAHDLKSSLEEVSRVLGLGGRFSFCDLGKPDSILGEMLVGFYLQVAPNVIGLMSTGRAGLRYGSIFDTYVLVLHNRDLAALLRGYFGNLEFHKARMGGAIVAKCQKVS